jgi:hypothetical protein
LQDIGRFGSLQFSDNYTNMLKHEVQVQPGEDFQDLLGNPTSIWNYESYAKARSDTSTTWSPSGGSPRCRPTTAASSAPLMNTAPGRMMKRLFAQSGPSHHVQLRVIKLWPADHN